MRSAIDRLKNARSTFKSQIKYGREEEQTARDKVLAAEKEVEALDRAIAALEAIETANNEASQ